MAASPSGEFLLGSASVSGPLHECSWVRVEYLHVGRCCWCLQAPDTQANKLKPKFEKPKHLLISTWCRTIICNYVCEIVFIYLLIAQMYIAKAINMSIILNLAPGMVHKSSILGR